MRVESTERIELREPSPLVRAALAAGPRFPPLPVALSVADVPRPVDRHGAGEREVLARLVRAGLEPAVRAAGELPGRVDTSLRSLAREGTFAVVTGQQPGFLASPLLCLYKAIQACRLATELSRRTGAPVVPIFWNHADDHDVAEVHHAWLLNRNVDLQKIALPGMASGRTPIGDLPLSSETHRLAAVRAQLLQTVEEHPFAERALELLFPRDGETLARVVTRAFTALLGEHGLVVVEPSWIRPLLSSELGRIVGASAGDGAGIVAALERGEAALAEHGWPVAIPVRAGEGDAGAPGDRAALVFRHDPERGRVALRAGGEGFRYDGEPGSRTPEELAAEIVDAPEGWSAGALLRPLVQDAVFPSCAYVGGLGELAYHAQLGAARDLAALPRTPFVPRVSCTLVDEELRFALERCGIDAATAIRAGGRFAPEPEEDGGAPRVIEDLRRSADEAARLVLEHRKALHALEPALAIGLKKAAEQIAQAVGKVADKAERVHKNRSGKGERHVRRVNNAAGPRHSLQERVLGPFAYVARYGDAFAGGLVEALPPVAEGHLVLHLSGDGAPPDADPSERMR